jgi:phosphoglycerol transferase
MRQTTSERRLPGLDEPPPHSSRRDPGWNPWREALLVVGVTATALTAVLHLWNQRLDQPFGYLRDVFWQTAIVKGILQNGWYEHNPRLGFPFGQDLGDFPLQSDNLHYLMIKFLGIFSDNAVLVTNLYFLLGFFLVALSAFFALRFLGISRWFALASSILFAFLPYHFLRGTSHLLLGAYWSIPIACVLILLVLREPAPLFPSGRGGKLDFTSRRSLLCILAALLLSSTGVYYAAFFVLLAVAAGLLRTVATGDRRPLAAAVLLSVIVVFGLAAHSAPALLHQYRHGKNPEVAARTVEESDLFALRPIQMIMPTPGHRIGALADLTARSLKAPNNSEGNSYLGLVGTVGFLGLLLSATSLIAGRPRGTSLPHDLAVPVIPALLFGVTGGLSWVLGLAGLTQFRSWNRISVFIAFFSLAAVAWAGDVVIARTNRRRRRSWLAPAAALTLIAVGVLDQTTSHIVPDTRRYRAEFENDQRFVHRVERALGPGDAVFQLPYLSYPESDKSYDMFDYDPLRGYLYSDKLRWSYGGMWNREGDWQVSVVRKPLADLVESIVAVGFRGLWIDRFGYADRAQALEKQLAGVVPQAALTSDNGRFSFFSLQSFADAQRARLGRTAERALRRAALALPRVRPGMGFSEARPGTGDIALLGLGEAVLEVTNRSGRPQRVVLDGRMTSADGRSGTLSVIAGGHQSDFGLGPDLLSVRLPFTLQPGKQEIRFLTTSSTHAGGPALAVPRLEVLPAPP